MSWVDYFWKSWTRFSDFTSKSDRKEFWIFALFNLGIFFLLFLFVSYTLLSSQTVQNLVTECITVVMSIFDIKSAPEFTWNTGTILIPCTIMMAFLLSVSCWILFVSCPIVLFLLVLSTFAALFGKGIYPIQVTMIYLLVVMIPYLALTVRRLRHAGCNLIVIASQLIPVVGPIMYVCFLSKQGTESNEDVIIKKEDNNE